MNTIKGLRKVAGASKGLRGHYGALYLQLMYDVETGRAWADEHTQGSWSQYDKQTIVFIGKIHEPTTQKELRRMIVDKMDQLRHECVRLGGITN